jgi:hypothetical protein
MSHAWQFQVAILIVLQNSVFVIPHHTFSQREKVLMPKFEVRWV